MNVSMIDTRHGTDNQYSFSHGNCLPYTGVPFGMNYFAPKPVINAAVGGFIQKIEPFRAFASPISLALGWGISAI
ncbi:hypothetical protein I8F96_11105 [Enterococcus casseliflavus]|nr:hypothetical protein [Enterococcus casseliflavus]